MSTPINTWSRSYCRSCANTFDLEPGARCPFCDEENHKTKYLVANANYVAGSAPPNELEKFLTEHPPKPFKPHVWWRPQEGLVDIALEDVSYHAEWIKGEGGDIAIWRANDNNRVVGATLPFNWPARMTEPIGGREGEMASVLRQIVNDLTKRYWLDPVLEERAKAILEEYAIDQRRSVEPMRMILAMDVGSMTGQEILASVNKWRETLKARELPKS